MTIRKVALFTVILYSFVSSQNLTFIEPEKLYADGAEVDNPFGTPTVEDWDDDGVNDLLVGEMVRAGPYNYLTGKLALYKNKGTNSNPDLTGPQYIGVNGQDIELTAG